MKHKTDIVILMVIFFLASQIIGLIIVQNYSEIKEGKLVWKHLPSLGPIEFERPQINKDLSFIYIFLAIIIGTLFFMLLLHFRISMLWKFWFFIAIFICLYISFSAFLTKTLSLPLALLLSALKLFRPSVVIHNVSELFIYGGLAAIFVPVLNPFSALLLLVVISLYDIYAVWKSKHMIKLAKFQMKSGAFAGILFPYQTKFARPKKESKIQTAVLGGGDMGFPLIFTGTLLGEFGWSSLIVSIFTTFALAALFILGKKGKFYPAMPFLSLGCFIGYIILLLIN